MLFALRQINSNDKLLANITIGARIYDTCRSQTIGADRAKDIIKSTLVDDTKPLVGVIGPFKSDVSIAVANLLRIFEIPQISYGSSSAELSNKELYGNFFRTVPPDSFQAKALVDVILYYGWNYVYAINSYGNYGQKGMELFQQVALEAGICIAAHKTLPSLPTGEDYRAALRTATDPPFGSANVIVLFTSQTDSAGLLSAAKESGITHLRWLGSSGWSNRVDVAKDNEEIANGSLTVGHRDGDVEGFSDFLMNLNRPLGNDSNNSWFEEVLQSVLNCTVSSSPSQTSLKSVCKNNDSLPRDLELAPVRVVVNAVYAMAYALSDLHKEMCPGSSSICEGMRKQLQRRNLIGYLKNVTFPDSALELNVTFNENQEMEGEYSIINFQQRPNDEWRYVRVGSWRSLKNSSQGIAGKLLINGSLVSWGNAKRHPPASFCSEQCDFAQVKKPKTINPQCCWDCERCGNNEVIVANTCRPCDVGYSPDANLTQCLKLELSYVKWTSPLSATLAALGSVGLIAALMTCAFFVKYRHHSVIKAAGKELCFLILIGILMIYASSFLWLAKPTDVVCTLRYYVGCACFTFCYAPLLIKTNRIYRIFTNATHSAARPSMVRPSSQVVISLAFIAVQVTITTVWILSNPAQAIVIYPSLKKAELVCNISAMSVAVNLSFNLILMFLCTVFAFKTRNFPRNFNEAKHTGISMYITCSLWVIFTPTYLNMTSSSWRNLLFCFLFIAIGSVNLTGLLVPRMVLVVFS